jgi:superoxide dismutase, Cu-Zn family
MRKGKLLLLCLMAGAGIANADELKVEINLVDATGASKPIGTVVASESPYGTVFTPGLSELAPGVHGFHIHQNPDCGALEKDGKKVPALAAGGHYDPANTGKHEGPWGNGHLGDLPALYVGADGKATTPVLAPRVKLADLKGRSLMIHAGGDNHADHPEKLGGGGPRVACGVVK